MLEREEEMVLKIVEVLYLTWTACDKGTLVQGKQREEEGGRVGSYLTLTALLQRP
jgi:hypothetical protein